MTTSELASEATVKKSAPESFIRFSLNQRVQHVLLMVSFIVLSVTGLAQRFYTSGWGQWVILGLGGIDYTRLIHRGFGLLFTLIVLYHFGYLAYVLFVRHSKPSMVPTLEDFRDTVATLRYSFGFTEKLPRFGRFNYNQKFEYWGLIFGSFVIITTGFVLAFPILVTRFLSGQVVAASVEFHGFEATLAVLTIVIWHMYDVILKPGIFPADVSIFTGRISKKRMLEEHSLEFAGFVDPQSDEKTSGEKASAPPSEEPVSEPTVEP